MPEGEPDPAGRAPDDRFRRFGEDAAKVVQQAAAVLEEELAAGLAGTRKLQRRLIEERRVDQAEFEEVMQRFGTDVHDLVDVLRDRIADLRSDENQELAQRFATDAHDVVDTLMDLVKLAPDIVNGLAKKVAPERRETADTPPDPVN